MKYLALTPPLLFLITCASPTEKSAPFTLHPDDSLERVFVKDNVEGCLDRAYAKMLEHKKVYAYLKRFLKEKASYKDLLKLYPRTEKRFFRGHDETLGVPKSIFLNYDGGWRGKWGKKINTKHIWFSMTWDVQPVMIKDNDTYKKGINLVHPSGTICGIVMDGPDNHRLHEGLLFAKQRDTPEYLKWMTPQGNYYEWLDWTSKGRKYHIQEHKMDESGNLQWAVRAKYRQWHTRTTWVMSSIKN